MRDVARRARDAGHGAPLVELDQRLREIEIDGAAAHALAVEHQRQLLHQLEALHQRPVALAHSGVAFEQQVDIGIGHALHAADDAGCDFLGDNFALVIDLQQRRKHQPVFMRHQRAEVGGKLERQHGDSAVRKVDAGAAQACFRVDGAARFHVVADVGDMHLERVVAVGQAIHPHGIVEISRGFAVDGDDVERAEIAAAFQVFGVDGGGHPFGLFHHFGRKLVRQVVLADDDFNVHSEIVGMAQNLDDAAGRGIVIQQLHIYDHAVEILDRIDARRLDPDAIDHRAGGRKLHAFGNVDPLADAVVERHHVLPTAPNLELADHRGVGALEHLDDFAIGAAIGLDAGDARHHAIAVHGLRRGVRRDEDVSGDSLDRPFGNDESVTIPVHVQTADGVFPAARRHGKLAGSRLQQVAAGRQTGQRGLQFLAFRALRRQFPDELLEVGARMRQAGDVVEKRAIRHSLDFTCNAWRRVTLLSRANSRLLQPGEFFHPSCTT